MLGFNLALTAVRNHSQLQAKSKKQGKPIKDILHNLTPVVAEALVSKHKSKPNEELENWNELAHDNLRNLNNAFDGSLNPAIEAVLIGIMVQSWTAFETLAGDLWVAALNTHPRILADLDKRPPEKRKKSLKKQKDEEETKEDGKKNQDEKVVNLSLLTQHNYNISGNMGDILKSKFDFARWRSVREAYEKAFPEWAQGNTIGKIVNDSDSIIAINMKIRNLIVHSNGMMNEEFLSEWTVEWFKKKKLFPRIKVGNPLHFDGKTISSLTNPLIEVGASLIKAVDDWIVKHP